MRYLFILVAAFFVAADVYSFKQLQRTVELRNEIAELRLVAQQAEFAQQRHELQVRADVKLAHNLGITGF